MNNNTDQLKQYIDAGVIAARLGIARSGVFNLARLGKFPAGIKIGNSRRWELSEVLRWLDGLKGGCTNE